jgi:hypothetical protein
MCSGASPEYDPGPMGRQLRGTTIALAALLMLAATSALAANIVGTARNDVLRGTPAADRISGGKGNDRLFGLGGNDVLTGGPGLDRFDCGAGRDVANAQVGESVARNCEVVRRAPVSEPPPPPPSPPAPPAPPPAPPPPTAQAGKYCGFTQQGPGICLSTSADAKSIVELLTQAIVDCTNGSRWTWTVSFRGGGTAIQADLSFSYTYSGPLSSSSTTVTDIQTTYTISGRFGTAGDASGTVAISNIAFTYEGERYTCSQNPVPWTARK